MKKEFKQKLIQAKIEVNPPPSKTDDLETILDKVIPTIGTTGYKVDADLIRIQPKIDPEEPAIYYSKLNTRPKAIIDNSGQVSVKIDTISEYAGTWRMSKEDFDKAIADYISKFKYVNDSFHSIRIDNSKSLENKYLQEYSAEFIGE